MRITHPSREFDDAVAAVCHGTASDEQTRGLWERLRTDLPARDEYLFRVALHARLASDPDLYAASVLARPGAGEDGPRPGPSVRRQWATGWPGRLAVAAGLVVLLSVVGWLGRRAADRSPDRTTRAVAMLNRVVNARWAGIEPPPRLGAPLEPGRLLLESGLAQIVFYNGARVVIEGPAELRLVSASEAVCNRGTLTAEVPPPARGFRLVSPGMDLTDLGATLGLKVDGTRSELHVFEGRVEFRSDPATGPQRLDGGEGAVVDGREPPRRIPAVHADFAGLFDLQAKSVAAEARRHDRWRAAVRDLREDPSLWVHLDFEQEAAPSWRLRNSGFLRPEMPDATVVGCEWREGRWATKPALDFLSVSDRVRLNVPGELESVTLAAWVRIHGLDRQINSLFMSDGFAPGTLHWLIRHDGVLGLTVIGAGGGHQILASPPVMAVDQFGIWTHLAVVLDGPARQVVHYVNGRPVSRHALRMEPPFRIGDAELGNWNARGFPGGDPFLVRNFSGTMDEFCLFARALAPAEIDALHADGRPQSDAPTAAPLRSLSVPHSIPP